MKHLKNLIRKEEGFTLVELIVVIVIMGILAQIGLVSFNRYIRKTKAFAALETLQNIKTECETNKSLAIEETFTPATPRDYSIRTANINRCSGEEGNGFISALPDNTSILPTYFYEFSSGRIGCSFSSTTERLFLECNKRRDIESKDYIVKGSYLERGCSAYAVVEGPSWEEAEANAKKIGGNLVTINDQEENEWIVNSYQKMVTYNDRRGDLENGPYLPRAWIGLNDKDEEGLYKWSSGEEVTFRGTLDSGHFSGMKKTYGRFDPATGLRDDSLPLVHEFIEQDASSITLASDGNEFWYAGAWEDDWGNNTHYANGIVEVPLCN